MFYWPFLYSALCVQLLSLKSLFQRFPLYFLCCRSWRIYWRSMKPTPRPGKRRRTSTKKWSRSVSQLASQSVSQSVSHLASQSEFSQNHSIATCDMLHSMSLVYVTNIMWWHCRNIRWCFQYSNLEYWKCHVILLVILGQFSLKHLKFEFLTQVF